MGGGCLDSIVKCSGVGPRQQPGVPLEKEKNRLKRGLRPPFSPSKWTFSGKKHLGMDIEEHQRRVIEFRDARDLGQFQSKRSEVRASEVRILKDLRWS